MKKLDKIIEIAEGNLLDVDLHAATRGRALVARIRYGKRLANDIREAKKASKALNRLGISTRAVDGALKLMKEEVNQNSAIIVNLTKMYRDLCEAKRNEAKVVDALTELKILKEG